LPKEEEMVKKVAFFAVILIVSISCMGYAIDKKEPRLLNKISIDPTIIKEESAVDVVPEKTTITQNGCDTLYYHGGASYYLPLPDAYGDDFFNERFDIPYDCYLKEIRIAFYQAGSSGSPDAHIYVWNSNGMYPLDDMPPSGAIAEFIIPHSDLVWFPQWNVVETEMVGLNLTGGSSIHVGYSHAHNPGDTLAILSDDGSHNSTRSIEYRDGSWDTILDDFGVGVDFLIEIVVCEYGCCQVSPLNCTPATEDQCREMGGAWFPPPATCVDYAEGSFCTYPLPNTRIVEPNDTSIWDKNYFSGTLSIQAVDFQPVSQVQYTVFEYFDGVNWELIGIDEDGTTYMQDPWDTLQPGGDGWHAEWAPDLTLPEDYYMIRATMYNLDGGFASDTIIQYWDPYPPEATIIFPEVFNYPVDPTEMPVDIYFFTPGDNITEMYITVYPVPDYPGPEGAESNRGKFDCIQGYNKGVPHFNQHNLYPNGTDGKNRGCSPTSMAACLKYWAGSGFPCLNDSGGMSDQAMVQEIAGYAGTNPDSGTDVKKKKPAIEEYIRTHCGECVFQPVEHLQGRDVSIRRLIRELFENDEDVITGDRNHVTVVNSFCLHPKRFIDYMDPWTGTEVNGPMDVDSGFGGNPLIELVIVSPKETTVVVPAETVATTDEIEPVEPGTYHYPWYPDPDLFPVGRGYFVDVEITDTLGHKGWDLLKVELFLRGDATGDGIINSADIVYLINYLFKGGPAPWPWDAGDVNCDGIINSADIVYLINYLFKGGPPPGCP
jgi:hypothetical protein